MPEAWATALLAAAVHAGHWWPPVPCFIVRFRFFYYTRTTKVMTRTFQNETAHIEKRKNGVDSFVFL
ncbi:hypothetical protein EP10_002468 [Geobacillus icigianus]|uniref:Secreted protein n=1 Tax=Geobacillus icigianus TaxID=1430331 RepID=A0ABU6BHZ4_9BACL|nr:hypothetical protein [Geobacillus icigianus]